MVAYFVFRLKHDDTPRDFRMGTAFKDGRGIGTDWYLRCEHDGIGIPYWG